MMLRFGGIVFGPIRSRRLGSSLGINLLPEGGKVCNFDCIYCECGWNRDGRSSDPLPTYEQVYDAMQTTFSSLAAKGERVDSITFSGHGEPTLHPDFPRIVDAVLALRDKFLPGAAVSVLSNATTLGSDEVLQALRRVDNPILKLDAPTDDLLAKINGPSGHVCVEDIVAGMERMNGQFILQTMFLKGAQPDYETDTAALQAWMEIVRRVRPRRIMAYTLDRPAPSEGLSAMSGKAMQSLLSPLSDEGFDIQINGK